jgi:ketosteroid isomerase-like protein
MCPSRITFALAVVATACTTTTTPASPRFTADDERAIRAVDSVFVAAWLRDDTTAVMNTLAPGVVLMPAGQSVLTTPDAIRAFWWPSDGSHTRILTFGRAIDELGGEGDIAWMRRTDSLTFTYAKGGATQSLTSRSMSLAVLQRQTDGTWRFSRVMWGNRK